MRQMTARHSTWEKVQAYIWLGLAIGCLFFALVFWAITESKDEVITIEKEAETEVELQIQPEKVTSMTHLGALTQEVKPLDMTKRVAVTARHEAEFRGTKFLQEQQRNFTIELLRVGHEDLIKVFLRKQNDRKPFVYLRLTGELQAEQYVLFYGNYRNENEAKNALAQLAIRLPDSVQPQVVRWQNYVPLVNDLGADETVNQKIYAVRLKPAAVPKVDEVELQQRRLAAAKAAKQAEQQIPTTSTTVTRRDAEGNVIDVERSQSNSQPSTNTVQEVVDPFN